jgi:hypothetical protein
MPGLIDLLSQAGRVKDFLETMKLVLFSHMHLKNDRGLGPFIIDPLVVRDAMFKYSKSAKQSYFQNSFLAFLLAWFATNQEARNFANKKFTAKNKGKDSQRMAREINLLKCEALKTLQDANETMLVDYLGLQS